MKKYFILILISLVIVNTYAQDPATENTGDLQGVITTAVPFMLIAGDARSAGMADIGVFTSADAFSQQWIPRNMPLHLKSKVLG